MLIILFLLIISFLTIRYITDIIFYPILDKFSIKISAPQILKNTSICYVQISFDFTHIGQYQHKQLELQLFHWERDKFNYRLSTHTYMCIYDIKMVPCCRLPKEVDFLQPLLSCLFILCTWICVIYFIYFTTPKHDETFRF